MRGETASRFIEAPQPVAALEGSPEKATTSVTSHKVSVVVDSMSATAKLHWESREIRNS